jgi:hypothetical protein
LKGSILNAFLTLWATSSGIIIARKKPVQSLTAVQCFTSDSAGSTCAKQLAASCIAQVALLDDAVMP